MAQIIPIYIPTFIGDQNYNPTRVLPHIYFYNGLIDCETYWIESGSAAFGGVTYQQNAFPYFDNYNVVSGSFPTTDSLSLLFNNEGASYGEVPTNNLYTTYWERYVSLLYNPYTRLITCEAIIPLADYVKMELNDVVNFRGNYYHLRAINDYSLKTGECSLQLLGPIIADTISDAQPEPPPPPTPFATASIKLAEYNESPTAFLDANLFVSGTAYFFSGDFTQSISGGTTANVTLEGKDGGSTVWGPYTTASATLTIRDNGTVIQSASVLVFSGSGDADITFPITFTSGHNFQITGSTAPTGSLVTICCTPTITTASVSGADISIFFTTGSSCSACTATTIQTSLDGSTWGGNNTGGCNSPRVITAPTASTYYRMYETCTSSTSSFSNSYYFVSGSGGGSATLAWSFTESSGARGQMDLYVNGSIVETRSINSSGTYTVYVGDTINVEVSCFDECGGNYSNAYCTGIINDADCQLAGTANIFTSVYTVVSGDVGNTLTLNNFAACDVGCI
jgi:hypothetical protein